MELDYTLVVGVDRKHLWQLGCVWPTWMRHKPSLREHSVIIFFDREEVEPDDILRMVEHTQLRLVPWPPKGIQYPGGDTKWDNSQRIKMLSGFVHVPAMRVETKWWLKIDTDAVAVGQDDWINPAWFAMDPAIISHRWGYTCPASQMDMLDDWVKQYERELSELSSYSPLELHPFPNREKLHHPRIASWCGLFETEFTRQCSLWANNTVGFARLPVPSQDGYMWYCASRLDRVIVRENMKNHGWTYWSTGQNIRKYAAEAMLL